MGNPYESGDTYGDVPTRDPRCKCDACTLEHQEELEREAIDLALNDCQMWDNLPEYAKATYRMLAEEFVD